MAKQPIDPELIAVVKHTVEEAMATKSSGNGTPKNWMEFLYFSLRTFGVPVVALGVLLLIFYQTFPGWVQASIETQKSLTKNLDLQTENITIQRKHIEMNAANLQEVTDNVAGITKCWETMAKFQGQVSQQHEQQTVQHEAMISTLGKISEKLNN